MTQQFPITAQVVYDTLVADTTFTSYLGSYRFRGGGEVAALSIVTPGQDLPAIRKVEGVECIIHDIGDTEQFEYLTNDPARVSVTWSVFLICWEPATGARMQQAVERLLSRFKGSSSLQTVAVADGLGAMVQTKISIRSDMPVLPA